MTAWWISTAAAGGLVGWCIGVLMGIQRGRGIARPAPAPSPARGSRDRWHERACRRWVARSEAASHDPDPTLTDPKESTP